MPMTAFPQTAPQQGSPAMAPIEQAAQTVGMVVQQVTQMQLAIGQELTQLVASVNEVANSAVIRPFNNLAAAMQQQVAALAQTNEALMKLAESIAMSLQLVQESSRMQAESYISAMREISERPVYYEWDRAGRVRVSRRQPLEEVPMNELEPR